jgi:putative membrane protein
MVSTMRLVVCIDRDDDLGRKASVTGPVVGRSAVLAAAEALGVADPGDTDTNAMFAAVQVYDELTRNGEPAEIVVLTGSPKVGLLSDRKVAEQFDQVLRDHPSSSAHLVSDGAEDEFLFPIIMSRLKVDGVHRVIVRQSPSIESTYYTILSALKDPKFRHKTVLPPALVLLFLGAAALAGVIAWGVVALLLLLGVYLVMWTFDIDEAIIESVRSASSDIRQGSVAFGFGVVSLALVSVGFLEGYNLYVGSPGSTPIARVLQVIQAGLIWWFLGGVIWESGRALRRYLSQGRIGISYPVATISIVGLAFISYAAVSMIEYLENLPAISLPLIVGGLVLGLGLIVTGGVLSQYFKSPGERAAAQAGDSSEPTPAFAR